jgi:hypothetical protein
MFLEKGGLMTSRSKNKKQKSSHKMTAQKKSPMSSAAKRESDSDVSTEEMAKFAAPDSRERDVSRTQSAVTKSSQSGGKHAPRSRQMHGDH